MFSVKYVRIKGDLNTVQKQTKCMYTCILKITKINTMIIRKMSLFLNKKSTVHHYIFLVQLLLP